MNTTEITEILYEYDCEPLIHIRQVDSGQKYYCNFMDYSDGQSIGHYLMVPVTDADIDDLKANRVTIRSILDRPERYWLTCDYKTNEDTIELRTEPVPPDCLPDLGVKLNREPWENGT